MTEQALFCGGEVRQPIQRTPVDVDFGASDAEELTVRRAKQNTLEAESSTISDAVENEAIVVVHHNLDRHRLAYSNL